MLASVCNVPAGSLGTRPVKRIAGLIVLARSAVADGDIVRLIHGRARHPAVSGIRSEGALLIHPDGTAEIQNLIPADRHSAAVVDRMVYRHTLVIGEFSVAHLVHEPVAQRVQTLRGPLLRHAGTAIAAGQDGVGYVDGPRSGQSGSAGREVQRELPQE